ncbi:hypothetical protein vseg_004432 [Gypsophila vaccaria]
MALSDVNMTQSHELFGDTSAMHNFTPATRGVCCGGGAAAEEQWKKVRKPYTITKSRENWSDEEHDKFLEALHLFDRDWKKIEAFVGSKTVIQIRSHAQKYFLKVQKTGSNERVPPPRPKRKASHPYPQKASKISPAANQPTGRHQSSFSDAFDPMHVQSQEPSSMLTDQSGSAPTASWSFGSVPVFDSSNVGRDDAALGTHSVVNCCSSSNESAGTWPAATLQSQIDKAKRMRVMPDFCQVYSFIGSVFDPGTSDHFERLMRMDPINVETVLLLMRNLSANLLSPEFEEHRKLLASYDVDSGKAGSCSPLPLAHDNPKTAIPAI